MIRERLSGWAAIFTCLAMFVGITSAESWFSVLFDRWLPWLGSSAWLVKGAVILASSFGLYKGLFELQKWLLSRWRWPREWILGRFYVEGTWVGRYWRDGKPIDTVEQIDQSGEEIRIQGWAFDQRGNPLGNWASEVAAIDANGAILTYAYQCNMSDRSHSHHGLAKFTLIRDSGGCPHTLDGYAADLPDGQKDANREFKVSSVNVEPKAALKLGRKQIRASGIKKP